MSANHSTTKQAYHHISEGLKPAEIAKRLSRNRSTIYRELKRGIVRQVKQ
ncbi:hypothetical protein GCM10011510_07870 [Streptococcus himalayensis]|uniref:Transposase IS30-like HTH domain-containing protein n=1 Tax=Streptococcus himalayensis TaxID=1888195 RepID=A0A917A5S9_9STRE|nr:hypothetical protein GCM10011510_07870 [Streptococcus himalayensis]